jgi:hypothetical protein
MHPRYGGITGAVFETGDIASELGISYGEAMPIQEQRAALRAQEYLDAIAEIESNVIQFRPRARHK